MKNRIITLICIIILITFLFIFLLIYNSKFEIDKISEVDVSFIENIDNRYNVRINSNINEYINMTK